MVDYLRESKSNIDFAVEALFGDRYNPANAQAAATIAAAYALIALMERIDEIAAAAAAEDERRALAEEYRLRNVGAK